MSEEVMSADSLLTTNAELSRQIGEQNTTIGYQDAMLAELKRALDVAMLENDQHQAVNAALVRELVYARAVVAQARAWAAHETSALPIDKADVDAAGAVLRALEAYDQATKVSNHDA